jgi:hypothetical protein
MGRRARLVTIVVLVLVLAGAGALMYIGHNRLDDAQTTVDQTWAPLRTPLAARYLQLAALAGAFRDAGAGGRDVAGDVQRQLDRWGKVQSAKSPDGSAHEENAVEIANELEGSARRLIASVNASDRLRGIEALTAAIAAFRGAVVPNAAVRAYNDAVDDYQTTRDNALWSPAAKVFGYDARSTLGLGI